MSTLLAFFLHFYMPNLYSYFFLWRYLLIILKKRKLVTTVTFSLIHFPVKSPSLSLSFYQPRNTCLKNKLSSCRTPRRLRRIYRLIPWLNRSMGFAIYAGESAFVRGQLEFAIASKDAFYLVRSVLCPTMLASRAHNSKSEGFQSMQRLRKMDHHVRQSLQSLWNRFEIATILQSFRCFNLSVTFSVIKTHGMRSYA